MYIFYLDRLPIKAAQMMCDKHVVKMIVESAQMLSTAHRYLCPHEYCEDMGLYKKAFYNHPCTIWTRTTHENYRWLLLHWITLCEEFYVRYGKYHKSWTDLQEGLMRFPMDIQEGELTEFAQAMNHYPDCKVPGDAVQAYRNYYHYAKDFAKWEWKRPAPDWWEGYKGA